MKRGFKGEKGSGTKSAKQPRLPALRGECEGEVAPLTAF